jgi:squalene-hopene/tetraprenyl-beta-curcumene cyclase
MNALVQGTQGRALLFGNSVAAACPRPARIGFWTLLAALAFANSTLTCPLRGADAAATRPQAFPENLSFRHELEHAIDRGLAWLSTNQNPEGWWSTPAQPAVTALALTAFTGHPKGRTAAGNPAQLRNGYRWLLSCVQPDGGIHRSNLVTYNTALSINALLSAQDPSYDPILRRARRFLIGLQRDFDEKGKIDNVLDGGIGYGSSYEHSDMGNTLAALEAIHNTRHLVTDQNSAQGQDLNWAAAIQFLQNCQNLPAYNKQAWASDDEKNKGGFIYYPGRSMAGGETNSATGRVALRSYGSISYGGLLSYIYANLQRDDPRVVAVFGWLRRNYTLAENPGMGPQGLYYYFHTMTKALTAYDVNQLELQNGQKLDWRHELAMRLLNLQQRDGSWTNDNGRWWEKDPALVTSYVVMSLEMISLGLK